MIDLERLKARAGRLYLTAALMGTLASILRQHRRKLERAVKRGQFVPPPGSFDANRSKISQIEDMLEQLKAQQGGPR